DARAARAALLSRGVGVDPQPPGRVARADGAQGLLHYRADRPLICGTLVAVYCGLGDPVRARPDRRPRRRAPGARDVRAPRGRAVVAHGPSDELWRGHAF